MSEAGYELTLTPEELEDKLNHSFAVGQSAGLGEASNYLSDVSASQFIEGHDDIAKAFRSASWELKERAKVKHPGQSV